MKSLTLKIKNGVPETIGISGDYVRVKTASVAVRIQVETGDVDATIEQGDALNLKPFTRLVISHADAAEQTITLLIGNGTSADSAKVGGSVAVTGGVAVSGYKNNSTFVHSSVALFGASVLAFAANANRKFIAMQNNDPAVTAWVRMDGAAAAVGVGFRLLPGESIVLDVCVPTAAIYVTSTGVGSAVMTLTEG